MPQQPQGPTSPLGAPGPAPPVRERLPHSTPHCVASPGALGVGLDATNHRHKTIREHTKEGSEGGEGGQGVRGAAEVPGCVQPTADAEWRPDGL